MRIFLLLLFTVYCYALPYKLESEISNGNINNNMYFFEDKNKVETIDSIKNKPFLFKKSLKINKGILKSNIWIKVDVINPTGEDITWYLDFLHKQYDLMESWYFEYNKLISHEKKGDHNIDLNKSFFEQSMFSYTTSSVKKGTIYMLLSYEDGGNFELLNSVWTSSTITDYKLYTIMYISVIFSALGILLFYNIFLSFILKSAEYFYYNIYLIGAIFIMFVFHGISTYFLWPNYQRLIDFSPLYSVSFVYIVLVFFSRSFLNTKEKLPKIDKILIFFILIQIFALVVSLLFDKTLGMKLMSLIILTSIIFPVTGYYLWEKGDIFARGFTIASLIFVLIIVMTVLRFVGIIPTTELSFLISRLSFIIEGILLSIALADRINILKKQKNKIQKKMQLSLIKDKEFLEKEVKKRTVELEKAKINAEKLARIDELTKVMNRRAFIENGEYLIKEAQRYQTSLSLVLIDIDYFKKINDTYGHKTGDVVLQKFSKILLNSIRETDLLARIGGEEFVILFPHTNIDDSLTITNKIHQNIRTMEILYEEKTLQLTSSFGISELKKTDTLNSLLANADKALYKAKNTGRDKIEVL